MHLFIVRHGQSTGNITTEDVPDAELTPLGEQQARQAAARLATEGITHVLCSPLVRALATATTIAEACHLSEIEVWPELQETRRSVHRGFGRDALLTRFPLARFPHTFEAEGWDHGGETYESGLERGADAVAALRERFTARDRLGVVNHGAFANYLLRALLHIPPAHHLWFTMNNCGITHVRFHDPELNQGDWSFPIAVQVNYVNDVSHLSKVSE
ncbi:MAG TPA: histidine phosphatase family protein [Chloroflexota bacterium]|nr:histidine phosphatase family protein [Chloroflexota bacterium]